MLRRTKVHERNVYLCDMNEITYTCGLGLRHTYARAEITRVSVDVCLHISRGILGSLSDPILRLGITEKHRNEHTRPPFRSGSQRAHDPFTFVVSSVVELSDILLPAISRYDFCLT